MGFSSAIRITGDDNDLSKLVERVKHLLEDIPEDAYTLNKDEQFETYVNEYAQRLALELQVLAQSLGVARLVSASGISAHDIPEGIEVNDKGHFLAVMGAPRPRVCGLLPGQRRRGAFLYMPLDPRWKIERISAVQLKIIAPDTDKREGTAVETPSQKRVKRSSEKEQ